MCAIFGLLPQAKNIDQVCIDNIAEENIWKLHEVGGKCIIRRCIINTVYEVSNS
jgi:hypothetical protein